MTLRRRLRWGTTAACVITAVAGLMALEGGHAIHGGLLLLAAGVLLKGSVWNRRASPVGGAFGLPWPRRPASQARTSSSSL
jgi:hypothetical protein